MPKSRKACEKGQIFKSRSPKNSVSQRLKPSFPLRNHGAAATPTARKGKEELVISNPEESVLRTLHSASLETFWTSFGIPKSGELAHSHCVRVTRRRAERPNRFFRGRRNSKNWEIPVFSCSGDLQEYRRCVCGQRQSAAYLSEQGGAVTCTARRLVKKLRSTVSAFSARGVAPQRGTISGPRSNNRTACRKPLDIWNHQKTSQPLDCFLASQTRIAERTVASRRRQGPQPPRRLGWW